MKLIFLNFLIFVLIIIGCKEVIVEEGTNLDSEVNRVDEQLSDTSSTSWEEQEDPLGLEIEGIYELDGDLEEDLEELEDSLDFDL